MYLVSSYEVFWFYYNQLSDDKKLHYEIIPEGAVCKLYFDLEYSIPDNPESCGVRMVDLFIQYVCLWLEAEFRVKCNRKNVLDLDASTERKFSRHLIFNLSHVTFQDNVTLGYFVHHIMEKLSVFCESTNSSSKGTEQTSDTGTSTDSDKVTNAAMKISPPAGTVEEVSSSDTEDPKDKSHKTREGKLTTDGVFAHFTRKQLSTLFVQNKHGEKTAFCDMGVYTKNRNFRLYLSRKYGKKNPLRLAAENEFEPHSSRNDKTIFMHSLISNVKFTPKTRILKFHGTQKNRHGRLFSKTSSTACLEGYKASPYPEVDGFLIEHTRKLDSSAGIRHWTYFSQGEVIVYEMVNYRYCHNVQRSHKSNNVMFVVDLKKKVYYQKCLDPVCRSHNFKSSEFPLPESVFPSYLWEDDPMFDGEDEDLCCAADEMEKTMAV
nr:DNA-directed primase/polymerase protein-like isoform X2 [Crassostrea virginica]